MTRTPRRPSPALIIASLALLLALAGTSVAAVSVVLPRNSVGTAQLKSNAVVSAKVKNRSLLAVDFQLGQLPAGAQGPVGPAGAQGPKGDQGAPGISGLERVEGTLDSGGGSHSSSAVCAGGKKAISGGYSTASAPTDLRITTAAVLADGVTYRVDGASSTAATWNLRAFVLCANVA